MSDFYKHDSGGVASVVSSLNNSIEAYKTEIENLNALVKEINASSEWKDASVKTSFIETCNNYVSIFNNLINCMERYVKYLSAKSASADGLEEAFSRSG